MVRPSNFRIREVVVTAIDLLAEAISSSSIAVAIEVPTDLSAYAYQEDLQSALLNILDNAIHWMSTVDDVSREIRISAISIGSTIRIAVSNNGPVIDAENVPRLFSSGFSLKSDGMGLGLAIAKEACRSSKGDVLFDQNAIDTTFLIELPKTN